MRALKKPSPASDRHVEHIVESVASANHLDVIHEAMARFWASMPDPPGERWQLLLEVAVSEIAANILEHARPPTVTFRLRTVRDAVIAEFQDTGEGWEGTHGPARVLDELAERGRGLSLAMTAVDEVVYERRGSFNRWVLVKRLQPDATP
jgi:serine/threonine-protein kinase RsbW